MELLEGIFSRRSVRKFAEKPLGPDQLETIIKAGMYAPSGHNYRPWRFITVEDKEMRMSLQEIGTWWKMLDNAAVAIVVCVDTSVAEDMPREFLVDSCAAATENMLLAAHGLGLGGVWLGLCENAPEADKVRALLNIPEHVHLTAIVAVGTPLEPAESNVNRFEPEKWRRESW